MSNINSILTTIKTQLEIDADDSSFDQELILDINSELADVTHLGVGSRGFFITGDTETWDDFESRDTILPFLKQYIYFQVKKSFDGESLSSNTVEHINKKIERLEIKMRDEANGDFE